MLEMKRENGAHLTPVTAITLDAHLQNNPRKYFLFGVASVPRSGCELETGRLNGTAVTAITRVKVVFKSGAFGFAMCHARNVNMTTGRRNGTARDSHHTCLESTAISHSECAMLEMWG